MPGRIYQFKSMMGIPYPCIGLNRGPRGGSSLLGNIIPVAVPAGPAAGEGIDAPGCTWGFALSVSNLVNEAGFPPGWGEFCAQLRWDRCWRNGTVALSLSLSPGAASGEACGSSPAPLDSLTLPAGLTVQPPLIAWREEGWICLPASLPALQPPCPKPLSLTLAAFPARSQAIFSSIP